MAFLSLLRFATPARGRLGSVVGRSIRFLLDLLLWVYILVIYMRVWEECVGFEWDEGNAGKNWEKHGVADFECEELFFNQPLIVRADPKHSMQEPRFYALGRTDQKRLLFVAFTVRRALIGIISAREMTRKERTTNEVYEDEERSEGPPYV